MANKEAQRLKRERIIEENGIIFLDNVSKSYSTGSPALNGITLSIGRGEFVFIVGDSGSGKSTLIKLLLRELTATSGSVYVMGNDLARLKHRQIPRFRRNLGVVFQDFRLLNDRNVYENVAFAQRIVETPVSEIRRNVPAILATVGLAGKYKAKTKQLSGGEQQRVAVAKLLLCERDIYFFDEPTKGMDAEFKKIFSNILSELKAKNKTVVIISHDIDFCAENAELCAMLFDRNISAVNTTDKFFDGNRFYTTAANKISKGFIDGAITEKDVIECIKK